MQSEELNEIRRNTRALLGEDKDVSYITETLLADMERKDVEISPEPALGTDTDRTYYGYWIVDAVRYVAFHMAADSSDAGRRPSAVVWVEKPVAIVRSGECEDGFERYAVRKLSAPARQATSAAHSEALKATTSRL